LVLSSFYVLIFLFPSLKNHTPPYRLNRLLHKQSTKVLDDLLVVTPRSGREASVKLSALNKATVKMAAQLESLEEENESLKQKLDKVRLCIVSQSECRLE